MTKLTLIELKRERLEQHGWTVTESGCWEWAGGTFHRFGYGQLRILNKGYDAHRLAYEAWVGDPTGYQVRHTCDNPPCINPDHLVLGTSQDNHDDMVKRGRALTGEKNHRAKLTADQVAYIRQQYADNIQTQTALAKEFGIGQPAVSLIVHGERW